MRTICSFLSDTNGKALFGLSGLPIISQPTVGILGLDATQKRLVINDSIAIRSTCDVMLSCDDRVLGRRDRRSLSATRVQLSGNSGLPSTDKRASY